MKNTGKEEEQKRLRKNANQRRRYAQLSHAKKESPKQKSKERYAENKRKLATGDKTCPQSMRTANIQGHANQGIIIRDNVNEYIPRLGEDRGENPPNTRGKSQISSYNSFDIGSCSSGIQPLSSLGPIYQAIPPPTRKRSTLNKGSNKLGEHIPDRPVTLPIAQPYKEDNIIDEIDRFQSARWVSATEAMWRIYRFALNEMRPAVQSLCLHLEGHTYMVGLSFTMSTCLQSLLTSKLAIWWYVSISSLIQY